MAFELLFCIGAVEHLPEPYDVLKPVDHPRIGGFAVTVIWVEAFKASFYDLYEMIPGFAAGLLFCVVVSLLTEPDPEAAEELESVRRSVDSRRCHLVRSRNVMACGARQGRLLARQRRRAHRSASKKGLAATSHFEAGGFVRSNDEVRYPNLVFRFLPPAIRYDGTSPNDGHGSQVHVGPMYSDARGWVKIKTADPTIRAGLGLWKDS